MSKNIIIVVLSIALAGAVAFSIYKDVEARRQEALAVANAHEATIQRDAADMARREAEMQRQIAIANALMAENQRHLCDAALKNCKGK